MPDTLVTVAYLVAGLLFIFSLGGLSTRRRRAAATCSASIGMAIAMIATMLGPGVDELPGDAGDAGGRRRGRRGARGCACR